MSQDADFLSNFEIEEVEVVPSLKQKKQDMIKFIGTFPEWSRLNKDAKMEMMKSLDYWTRCNLSVCSKESRELVRDAVLVQNEQIRLKPDALAEMKTSGDVEVVKLLLRKDYLEVTTSSGLVRSWKFSQKPDGSCQIVSKTSLAGTFAFSNVLNLEATSASLEFARRLKKWVERATATIVRLEMHDSTWHHIGSYVEAMTLRGGDDGFKALKSARLLYRQRDEIDFWIDKMRDIDSLEQFHIVISEKCSTHSIPFESIDIRAVTHAKTLRISNWVTITDEQFLRLRNRRIVMATRTLSPAAILEFVRRWADSELDPDFSQCLLYVNNTKFREHIVKEIDNQNFTFERLPLLGRHSSPDWERFYSKFDRFHTYGGRLFQIEQRDNRLSGLSLYCCHAAVSIVRTGFPVVRDDGGVHVERRFPDDFIYF